MSSDPGSPPEVQASVAVVCWKKRVVDAVGRTGVYTGPAVQVEGPWIPETSGSGEETKKTGTMQYDAEEQPQTDQEQPLWTRQEVPQSYEGCWSKGHWQGRGRLVLSSGDTYEGDFLQSQRHGRGVYTWMDQQTKEPTRRYEGAFERNQRHGQGTYEWLDSGASYKGDFCRGVRSGQGVYTDASVEYRGEFQQGQYHGQGRYTQKIPLATEQQEGEEGTATTTTTTTITYTGAFCQGQPHGRGMEVLEDGTVRHDGLWKQGVPVLEEEVSPDKGPSAAEAAPPTSTIVVQDQEWRDPTTGCSVLYRGVWNVHGHHPTGNGTAVYQNATTSHNENALASYEGCFDEQGRFHGQGRLLWCNGDAYEGDFWHGQRHGTLGVYRWNDGRVYTGGFCHNQRHGPGARYVFANNDLYEGDFENGQRQGRGRFTFCNGSVYDGEWKAGLYHGQGTLVQTNGETYRGSFALGLPHGPGTQTSAAGQVLYEGEWIRGVRADEYVEETVDVDEDTTEHKLSDEHQRQQQEEKPPPPPKTAAAARPQQQQQSSLPPQPMESPPTRVRRVVSPQKQKEEEECEAVVDQPITDGQGNKGKYTGIVVKATRKPHGTGRIVYADGNRIHEGFWKHGAKEGFGRCLFFPQGDMHSGEYRNNLRNGPGRYRWHDGRCFMGEYKDDLRHGQGEFYYPSGEKYSGMFENGQRSGHGVYRFRDGGVYEGGWQFGRYHGHGVKKDPSGKIVQEGIWTNGKFEPRENYRDEVGKNKGSPDLEADDASPAPAVVEDDGDDGGVRPNEASDCDDRPSGTVTTLDESDRKAMPELKTEDTSGSGPVEVARSATAVGQFD